jgi:hypothetical protein
LTGTVEAAAVAVAAFLRPRLIDGQTAATELALIEGGARRLPLRVVGHFHEGKPARLTGLTITNQADGRDLAYGRKQRFEFLFFRSE